MKKVFYLIVFYVLVGATLVAQPTISNMAPADGSTGAFLEGWYTIGFNEDIQLGTGSVSLFLSDGTFVESIFVNSTLTDVERAKLSGRSFLYRFSTIKEELTDYYVTVSAGTVEDLSGVDYAGISAGELNFTTGSRPKLDIQSPSNNATSVALQPTIQMSFDEYVTVESGTSIVLRKYDNDELIESFNLYIDGGSGFEGDITAEHTISYVPSSQLLGETKYYLALEPVESVYDLEWFRQLDSKDGWTFTTEKDPTEPPVLTSVNPIDNSINVPLDQTFEAVFDEDIVLESGQFIVQLFRNNIIFSQFSEGNSNLSTDGSTLSFTLPGLEYATDYSIELLNIQDVSGNEISKTNRSIWSFTTVGEPFVITFSTTDGTFDFPVQLTGHDFALEWTNLTNPGTNEGSVTGLTDDYEITGLSNNDVYRLEANGNIVRPQFNFVSGNAAKVLSLEQWGDIEWSSLERTFESCINMQYNATDAPDLTSVTSLGYLFSNASLVNGDFSGWDVSGVQNFDATFNNTSLSSDLSSWDISNATNVQFMIYETDMDYEAYDATLTAWSNLDLPIGLSFVPRNLEYCQATAARQKIIDDFNWSINQDIERCRIYWDGSEWDISTGPQSYNEVFIEGEYTFSTDGVFEICEDLTVTDVLIIDGGGILEVTGDVITFNTNNKIIVESGSSLIILGNYSGASSVTAKRNITGNAGLSMVGSPIQSMNIGNQGADYAFKFNESTQQYESVSSETMAGGEGYFIGYNAASPTLSFTGTPFTGDVTVSIPADGFKIIANPYLGPIGHDSYNFDAAPGVTDGNIWLWDDGGSNDGGSRGGDYITVNSMGTASGGSGASGNTYEGFIPSFQAFFVKGDSDGGDITFTTSMMTTSDVNTDDHHFRVDESQIQKIKLSLEGEGYYNELIVGFAQEATEEDDFGLDAQKLESSNGFAFFSARDERKYAIQAFPPLENKREVSLGMNLPVGGAFEINVNELTGFDSDVLIELIDNETGLIYDLNEVKTASLKVGQGLNEERFQLHFSNLDAVLSTEESAIGFEITGISNDRIMVSHPDEQVVWKIMDASGKLLYEDTMDALNHQFTLPFSIEKDKLYILQGNTASVKLIIQ